MRKKLNIFLTIAFFLISLFFIGITIVSKYYIPSNLKLFVNQEQNFGYNLPFEAEISGDIKGVLEINNETVPENSIVIDLKKPFSITANQTGKINVDLMFLGVFPVQNLEVEIIDVEDYIPIGNTLGVTVKTDGILVLGTGTIIGKDNVKYSPCKNKLFSDDYIKKINGVAIENKEALIEMINHSNGEIMTFQVYRNGIIENIDITPIETIDNQYKIGLWVRDDTQGIGTLTYINMSDNSFAALGHGITDIDTNTLMKLSEGTISEALITNITKGSKGNPGEITGIIIESDDNIIGLLEGNTNNGIFGSLTDLGIDKYKSYKTYPIGFKYDIKIGEAYILSDVSGEMNKYKINIQKINLSDVSNKGMVIEVIDKKLIEETNGIVQGMSGSPIIQDDKLIGAVTHVFIQDSTKGYGTFIENMILEEY